MKILHALTLAAVLTASSAVADDQVDYSDDLVAQCVDQAETSAETSACIGLSAAACQNASDYGSTTIGLQQCSALETKFWDDRLNKSYGELMQRAEETDADAADDPRAAGPGNAAENLRKMQSIWNSFKDVTCDFESDQYPGGTIAGPIYASCKLRMTGEQAIYLENSWPTY